jgi:hypothetical protein
VEGNICDAKCMKDPAKDELSACADLHVGWYREARNTSHRLHEYEAFSLDGTGALADRQLRVKYCLLPATSEHDKG